MIRSLLVLFIFCASYVACAQKTYSVKGSFKGDFKGTIYLVHGDDKDSTVVKDGLFSFNGKIALPTFSYLLIKSSKSVSLDPFYLGDGEVVVELDTITQSGMGKNGRVESLSLQTNFLKNGLTDKIIDSVSKAIFERTKSIVDREEKAEETRKNVMAFVPSNTDKVAGAVVLQRYSRSFSQAELLKVYLMLSPRIKNTYEGKQIFGATITVVPIKIGEKVADFSQSDSKGNNISITSLKGNYVLVDFWASWCVPCREENPAVVKAYNKFKANGFTVLGVSLDSKKSNWLKAIKDDQLSWLHISDLNGWDNAVSKMFGIRSIPDNILIDKEGKVLARGLKGKKLEDKLEEIFAESNDK